MHRQDHINEDPEDFRTLPSFLAGIGRTEGQGLPEGYFELLPGRIEDRIEEITLLEEAPVFSQIPRQNPFKVPDGYFEELPDQIMAEIRLPDLQQTEHPAQSLYFRDLPEEIASSVVLDQLNIRKSEPFAVPADYFDWLPARIADRIAAQKTNSFSLASLIQWLQAKYLVPATCLSLVIAFFVINFAQQHTGNPASGKIALSDSDKKEVLDNIDFFGFEEGLVMDHIAQIKSGHAPAAAAENDAAIDYLLENTDDPGAVSTEN